MAPSFDEPNKKIYLPQEPIVPQPQVLNYAPFLIEQSPKM
jgi:hypothetical protein